MPAPFLRLHGPILKQKPGKICRKFKLRRRRAVGKAAHPHALVILFSGDVMDQKRFNFFSISAMVASLMPRSLRSLKGSICR
jgi:hypothetical protein